MIKSVKLDFDLTFFLDNDFTVDVTQAGSFEHGEGLPLTYNQENTIIHQIWWTSDQVDFTNIGKQLGIDVITMSAIKQNPGHTNPWHIDRFYKIKQTYPNDTRQTVRANIFLEDWKIGHFLQVEDKVVTHWKAGEGFIWDESVYHLSSNAGLEPKFTLQVSGFLNED